MQTLWHEKPYHSLDSYLKDTFGEKIFKIALDVGMSCPNRDGTLDTRGCSFCSTGGSGDFAVSKRPTIAKQLEDGRAMFGSKKTGSRFIAYFQAYTNTYAPAAYLEDIYTQALDMPYVAGISIATRPDCLPQEVICLLKRLRLAYPDKFIWIELGLQTIHEQTAAHFRRGYALPCFEAALRTLDEAGIFVIVHVILGLPFETKAMMLDTIDYLNGKHIFGIKLQLLHILKGTDMASEYAQGLFNVLSMDEYLDVVISCLERLDPNTIIHRLTGDGPRHLLIAPDWSIDKRRVLNALHQNMKQLKTWQGRCFNGAGTADSL